MAKFDLGDTIKDINDNPVMGSGEYMVFEQPQQVLIEANGKSVDDVKMLMTKGKPMTYREAIQQALLSDVNPQQVPKMPDKHKRSMLALKLVADKDVGLSAEDITLIKKSAKHSPQTSTVVYMRLVELLDPEEVEE